MLSPNYTTKKGNYMSGLFISVWVKITEAKEIAKGKMKTVVGFTEPSRIGRHPYKEEKQKTPSPGIDDCCQLFFSLGDWEIAPSKESRFFNKITLKKKEKGIVCAGD